VFGLDRVQSGEVRALLATHRRSMRADMRSPRTSIAEGLGLVSEDRKGEGLALSLSIEDNLTLTRLEPYARLGWLALGRRRRAAEVSMERARVKATNARQPVSTLSGGNQQKVALARWLATEPKVLILDEPTQGVDVGAKAEIHKIIRRLAARGLAVIMISSELPEVLGMSDRIGVMRGGKLVTILEGAAATSQSVMAAALGHDEISRTTAASITG
jgi:ABC-type sugar transport system ATPase subunit